MTKKFFITAAIPYVNAEPHIGHALEFVQTDVIKRYYTQLGYNSRSLSGGDENALKNVKAAEKAGIPVQKFVNENTEKFHTLTKKLNCKFDYWQKGSDTKKHFPGVQDFWKRCKADIYKKKYEGLYCLGCEAFYTTDELNKKGECFEHPGKPLQRVAEKNYFFRLSKYQDKLINLIRSDKLKIVPTFRKKEVLSFLKQPLQDISISRTNKRAKDWGVPVPDDSSQRIYVWFDALNIYQTGIGFGWNEKLYKKYWPADLHVIGKGITRFHAVYWPAFLLSAKLKLPKALFIHGYLTIGGQKLSKTVGNVVDPLPLIEKYGADAIRYYLLAKISPFKDGDFSEEKLKTVYNADLANGLGNLVARVAKLCETSEFSFSLSSPQFYPEVGAFIKTYKFDEALKFIWNKISLLDKKINEEEPWKLKGRDLESILQIYLLELRRVGINLVPFLPETSFRISATLNSKKIISEPLFPRIK